MSFGELKYIKIQNTVIEEAFVLQNNFEYLNNQVCCKEISKQYYCNLQDKSFPCSESSYHMMKNYHLIFGLVANYSKHGSMAKRYTIFNHYSNAIINFLRTILIFFFSKFKCISLKVRPRVLTLFSVLFCFETEFSKQTECFKSYYHTTSKNKV